MAMRIRRRWVLSAAAWALAMMALAGCSRPQPLPLVTATGREIGQSANGTEDAHTRATPGVLGTATSTPTSTHIPNYLPGIYQNDAPPTPSPTVTPLVSPVPTQTPAPTPTPTPPWPEPIDGPSASKLGIHAVGVSDPFVFELIRRVKPAVVKGAGSYGWLAEVKQLSPTTVTVARIIEDNQENWYTQGLSPEAAAQGYVESHLNEYRSNAGIDYWEGWNEIGYDAEGIAKLAWYGRFEAARACLMQQYGFKAAVGGFATGWPRDYSDLESFMPALQAAARCGGVWHLHEYNRPYLSCGVMPAGTANIIPGAPAINVPAGPLTLRYRLWYEGYLKPRGLGNLKLIISEMGMDVVPISGGCPDPGDAAAWRQLEPFWVANKRADDGIQAYLNELIWYDQQIRQDSYVIGATIFTAGYPEGGPDGWGPYDIHNLLVPLANYMATQR